MIDIKNVTYEYIRRDEEDEILGVEVALDGVSLSIKKGEFIVVAGNNGSGKTTLAKHINALLIPGEGHVIVDKYDTADSKNIYKIRKRVGMVFQNPDNQFVQSIVEDDVCFGPENISCDPEIMKKRVVESMKKAGIYELRDKPLSKLSGGEKQRVAIAGILAMKPKCIIFDEATSMIDPVGSKEILEFVHKLNRDEKLTVIWVTHNMNEAVYGDKLIVLEKGKIRMAGTPTEVFRNPKKVMECHLELPDVVMICTLLREKGIKLSYDILTANRLVEELDKRL